MGDFITARHSFNSGDLITVLPGFQKVYLETGKKVLIYQRLGLPANYGHSDNHPIIDDNGQMVCMNQPMFDMIKPLIEAQDYVAGFEIWQGEKVDFDFDLTRQHSQMPLPGGSIHHWASLIFPQLESDLTKPRVKPAFPRGTPVSQLVMINRTARYYNPYIDFFFLKHFQSMLRFIGTYQEYESFNRRWLLNIEYLSVKDFKQLGDYISDCKFFLGNQSMCWHLADAIKSPRILEVCSTYPNTFPTGANGYSFITQTALEYQFNKLINE